MCVCSADHTPQSTGTHTCTCTRYERMETIHRCQPNVVGSQAFRLASAFNADIGAWNVLSVTSVSFAFDGVPLADCIKRGVYDNWGSTLRTAYPYWSSLCATPTPSSATPTTATPRYCLCACVCLLVRVRVPACARACMHAYRVG